MYIVYKIINNINNKHYIGVHKTDNPNDGYFGSGKAIKKAIKKYGKNNFTKKVLMITEDVTKAYNLEKELTQDYQDRNNYNMKLGGIGGFTKEDALKGYNVAKSSWTKEMLSENGKKSVKNISKKTLIENGRRTGTANKGRKLTESHKEALRESWRNKKKETASVV